MLIVIQIINMLVIYKTGYQNLLLCIKTEIKNLKPYIDNHVEQRMQPLQPVSIKLVISHLRIRFVEASSVLADLSAIGNFPHSLGPK